MATKLTKRLRVNLEGDSQEEVVVQAVDSLVLKAPPSPAMKVATVANLDQKEATVEVNAAVAKVREAKTANKTTKMQLLEKLPSLLMVKRNPDNLAETATLTISHQTKLKEPNTELIVSQESLVSKKKQRLPPLVTKGLETQDLLASKDPEVASKARQQPVESRKKNQDLLVSQKLHVKERKVVRLKDKTDIPASQDSHVVAKMVKMKATQDLPVNQDKPVVAKMGKMKATQDLPESQDNLVEAKIIKVTQRLPNPTGPQGSTKIQKPEATIKVLTDALEDPVVKVVEVVAVKAVVTGPMANNVADEVTATAVVDFVPKVIALLLSEMV